MNSKMASLLILGGAGFGIYLETQDKLSGSAAIILEPNTAFPFRRVAVALLVLIFVLSMMTPKNGTYLLILLAIVGILADYEKQGQDSILGSFITTEKPAPGSSTVTDPNANPHPEEH